ncbi:L,D-transpeptidase family protein [Kribbella jejuensis]|uniref:Lipoprotein-anchoring transpeptidase ErfK/SrfK n=1 Tax=Kribbella jejuensis TaxID=236068 RepID=A0A542EM02_9ACTN|nr:L,D-transpeptidase [Kribbella jejuensis]TQJ16368.1 lipoprotein-anchoring transpeptidase ErfK/SrfK [Kribbella jejuensis]
MSRRRGLVAAAVVLSFVLAGCSDVAASETTPSPTRASSSSSPSTTPSTTTSPKPTPTPTPTVKPTPKPRVKQKPEYYALRVERQLDKLGYPVGDIDGDITARAKQALCAWRETHGMPVSRAGLTLDDAYSVLNATSRPTPTREPGIYVNKTCQILYQIVGKTYKRIVWISTGGPGYETPNRTGKVWRKWAGAHESSLYEDAYMYDSLYFLKDRPGIALHGSRVNSLVKPYPASHRCVRVLRPEIHEIFEDTPIGTKVQIYGEY